jgi:hypothetical protein
MGQPFLAFYIVADLSEPLDQNYDSNLLPVLVSDAGEFLRFPWVSQYTWTLPTLPLTKVSTQRWPSFR